MPYFAALCDDGRTQHFAHVWYINYDATGSDTIRSAAARYFCRYSPRQNTLVRTETDWQVRQCPSATVVK